MSVLVVTDEPGRDDHFRRCSVLAGGGGQIDRFAAGNHTGDAALYLRKRGGRLHRRHPADPRRMLQSHAAFIPISVI